MISTQAPVPQRRRSSGHVGPMSEMRRVHNPTGTELVYNQGGNVLTGNTSVEADLHDPVTSRLVRLGRLIVPPVMAEPEPAPEYEANSFDVEDEKPRQSEGRATRSKNKSGDK